MRRLIVFGALGALLALQAPAPAASTGRIEGQVINETTGRPQPGVELTLTTGTDSGESDVAGTTTSDDKGRYVFDDLTTGSDRFYALDARFDGGLFAGRPVTLPSNTSKTPVIESKLRVWDTTAEPGVIAIRRDDMFVVSNETGVGVIESVTVMNTSQMAYIGRGAEMLGDDSSGASLAFALPDAATGFNIIDSTLDVPELVDIDQGVAATIAIPPGENRTTFSYALEGDGGTFDLSRPALYPILEMSIFAAEPLEIRSNRLVRGEGVELEGKRYERWSADEAIDAGDPLQAIAVASGSVPVVPLVLAASGIVAFLAVMTLLFRRRKTAPPRVTEDRDELLERVAKLDLSFESGEIDRTVWDEQRSPLVERLRESEGSK